MEGTKRFLIKVYSKGENDLGVNLAVVKLSHSSIELLKKSCEMIKYLRDVEGKSDVRLTQCVFRGGDVAHFINITTIPDDPLDERVVEYVQKFIEGENVDDHIKLSEFEVNSLTAHNKSAYCYLSQVLVDVMGDVYFEGYGYNGEFCTESLNIYNI